MFKPLSFFIGFRYVYKRNNKGFSSFISTSSTVGIAIGVMVLIIVLSAMNGFEKALTEQLLSVVPHAEIIGVNQPLDKWHKRVAKISQHQHVIAAAPFTNIQAMMQKKGKLKGVEIIGVDAKLQSQVSALHRYITVGDWQSLDKTDHIIIGSGIAKKLKLSLGDNVILLVPPVTKSQYSEQLKQQFPIPVQVKLKVGGIFNFGGTIDNSQAYINLAKANTLLGFTEQQAQGIRIRVDNAFNATSVIRKIGYDTDFYVYMSDWTRSHGHIYHDIQLVRLVMFIVLVLVIAVASFNIVSTLIMAVNEKKSDIAILKTMGATPSVVMASFVFQGLTHGLMGCIIGVLLGVGIALNLTEIMQMLEHVFATKFLSSDVYFIDYLPTVLHQRDVIITVVITLVIILVSTVYPAWRATKVEPAQELGFK